MYSLQEQLHSTVRANDEIAYIEPISLSYIIPMYVGQANHHPRFLTSAFVNRFRVFDNREARQISKPECFCQTTTRIAMKIQKNNYRRDTFVALTA